MGNQGAVRSAYLLNYPISKETFIATAAIIASIVDFTRIPFYLFNNRHLLADTYLLTGITTAAALAGTFTGKTVLKKVALRHFKTYVAAAIILIGVLLTIRVI